MAVRRVAGLTRITRRLVCPAAGPDNTRATDSSPWFTDATESSGVRMTHFNGMAGDFLYPEVMAPGVALFDYDNDGDLDLFVPQGRMLGTKTIEQALVKPEQPLQRPPVSKRSCHRRT